MNLTTQACTYSPMIIMIFILPKARKIGKKSVLCRRSHCGRSANLILFFLRNLAPEKLMWVFLVMCFISGCGLTTVVMQLWSMATDTIDEIEVTNSSRDDGTAYSVFNSFRKLGQVISAICVNVAPIGMNYKYEKEAVKALENLRKMYDLANLIPLSCLLSRL